MPPLLSTLKVLSRGVFPWRVQKRFSGGHGHQMRIQPSQHYWGKFKDTLHFYILLGLVPLTAITMLTAIFVGPAELTEYDPEDYTPEYWEYFKHPVSRFIAKYISSDKVIDYETFCSKMAEESENMILKKIDREIFDMMRITADNKSYFYAPYQTQISRFRSEREMDVLLGDEHQDFNDGFHREQYFNRLPKDGVIMPNNPNPK